MRSPLSTTNNGCRVLGGIIFKLSGRLVFTFCQFFILSIEIEAQKVAILAPDKTPQSTQFAAKFGDSLSSKMYVLDASLSDTAFQSIALENAFNLSLSDAKRIGGVIGCDFFVIVRSETLRRAAVDKPDYFESFAAIFVVSSRTGRLIYWKLHTVQKPTPEVAEQTLYLTIDKPGSELAEKIATARKSEVAEPLPLPVEEIPDANTPAAKNFRSPVPYKRLKPEYTSLAYLYDVKATIDILVDLDEKGNILRTEILRWAGFGLDESVTEAVRQMNWRPAERNGKTLPMRFLVRYNFKKVEKD